MTDRIVYRTGAPEALALWETWRTKTDEFRERVAAVAADLGFSDRGPAQLSGRIIGFSHDSDTPPPPGWRIHPRTDKVIVPDRRTQDGKATAALLEDLKIPNLRDHLPGGMPGTVIDFDHLRFADGKITRHGDALYVTYEMERMPEEYSTHIDAGMWEPVALSEYYALIEREEDTERAS